MSGNRVGWGWVEWEWERGGSVDIRGMKWESNHPKLMNVHEEIYYFYINLKTKVKVNTLKK